MKPVGVKGIKAFDFQVPASYTGKQLVDEIQAKVPLIPITLIH